MADQAVHFSENLNCVIGGRGSGKSTLLEYLRLALDSKQPDRGSLDPALEKKRQQIFASLRETSGEVRVEYETERGIRDILLYSPASATPRQILSRAVDDVPTVLGRLQAQFFSQGELTRFTSDGAGRAKVREIVDSAAGPELEQLKQEELDLQSKLKRCFQAAQECRRLQGEIRSARQASVEIARQLEALTSVEAEAKASQAAVEADAFLKDLAKRAEDELQAATSYVMSLSSSHLALPGTSASWPEIDWFRAALTALNEARAEFEREASDSLQRLKNQFQNILGDTARERPLAAIADARQNFRLACEAKGLAVENLTKFEELTQERQTKISFIDAREAELQTCSADASALDETLRALQQLWRTQFELRARVASALQSKVVSQSIRVRVAYMGDRQSFLDRWIRLAPRDGRGKLARRWEELGSDIYQAWESRQDLPSPWEIVEEGRGDPRALPHLYGEMADDLQPALLAYLDSSDAREMWEAARGTRIDDEVDVDLFREDGSAAGNLLGTLSEGQRNTVLLNMILAMGNGPIVIDQPEDELDAGFIYKSLVTDLRSAKEGRQLLIATHNANLPVNGDAEFILALEARDGRGMQRTLGGLDRRHVVQAVVDIMEGSEEAFRRRSDKYHF